MTQTKSVADYKTNIGRKSVAGKRAMVERGFWVSGRAPYGYTLVRLLDEKTSEFRAKLEINKDQAEVIRQIFRWYASGIGTTVITGKLKAGQVPSPGKSGWYPGEIIKILGRPTYVGMAFFTKGREPMPAGHKAIVTRTLWDKVQNRLADNRRTEMRRGGGSDRPLAFVVRCLTCGAGYKLAKVAGGVNWLGCRERYCPGPTCSNTRLAKEDDLVTLARGMLASWFKPANLRQHWKALESTAAELNKQINVAENRIVEIEQNQNRLIAELATGEFPRERLRRRYDELDLERQAMEKSLAEYRAQLPDLPPTPANLTEYCHRAMVDLAKAEGPEFRKTLQRLGIQILVGKETVEIGHAAMKIDELTSSKTQATRARK